MISQKNNYSTILNKYKVLILGSGYLAKSLKGFVKKEKNFYFHTSKQVKSEKYFDYLPNFINKFNINLIINCIGETRKGLDFDDYYFPNIIFPLKILNILVNSKILFVNFTTNEETFLEYFFATKKIPPMQNYYGLSKKIFSEMIRDRKSNYIYNIMLPVIYGGKFKSKNLYSTIQTNINFNKKTLIHSPNTILNFVHISDFIQLLFTLLKIYKFKKKCLVEFFSNNKPISVKDFLQSKFESKKLFFKKSNKTIDKSITTTNQTIINYFS